MTLGVSHASVTVYDAQTYRLVTRLAGHNGEVNVGSFAADGRYLVTGGNDTTLRLWDLRHGASARPPLVIPALPSTLSLSGDGRRRLLSVGGWDVAPGAPGVGVLYDVESGRELFRLSAANDPRGCNAMDGALSPDGRLAALYQWCPSNAPHAFGTYTLTLWDTTTGTLLHSLTGFTTCITDLDFSPDGRELAGSSCDASLAFWDVATGALTRHFVGFAIEEIVGTSAVQFAPDGRAVLVALQDGSLLLLDAATGATQRTFPAGEGRHTRDVTTLAFSADGRYLFSGGFDGLLIRWDVQTGVPLQRLVGHRGSVFGVALSPDGRFAFSAGDAPELFQWDLTTGEVIRRYSGHTTPVRGGLVLSPDGHTLISTALDQRVRFWRVDAQADLPGWMYAHRYVPELTCAERALYQLAPLCDAGGIFPTRTPVPTALPFVGLPATPLATLNPVALPTMAFMPVRSAAAGTQRGTVRPGQVDLWVYQGRAGEVVTIRVNADQPVNLPYDDVQGRRASGGLDAELCVWGPDSLYVGCLHNDGSDPTHATDARVDDYVLPLDGPYRLMIFGVYDFEQGGYTLTIESLPPDAAQTTATP